jgi:hypothetical protein
VKKIFSFTVLMMLFFVVTKAQLSVGIQGGSNLSTMNFTNNVEYKLKEVNYIQGFIGGFVVQYLNEKHAGVQAEINYSQRGWIEMDTIAGNNLKYKNKINYVEMPILTHVNMGGGNFRGVFEIGPYLAYALSANKSVEDLNTGSESSSDYTFDADTDNRLDFCLMVGGGLEYRFPFGKFAAVARYTVGLGDIDKAKVQQSEVSQYRIVSVLLRFTIPLTKPVD